MDSIVVALNSAQFNGPAGVTLDGAGNLYVADYANNRIRKVAPNGFTTTLAGNGTSGFFDGTGAATGTTMFSDPHGLAFDSTNSVIYVADNNNERIRKVALDGTTTTLAGNGTIGFVDGTGGPSGSAEFTHPFTVGVDSSGTIYVADDDNAIRAIAPTGDTTTLVKNGGAPGTGCAAGLNSPRGVVVSGKVMFVSDLSNNRILRIQLP
jgi:sugar lactone lactonase YvrE